MSDIRIFSVSALNAYMRRLIESDQLLQDVWIEGEVSNFRTPSSGHLYFTLKDAYAELRVVVWRDKVQRLTHQPQNGERIRAHGHVNVYAQGGTYQLHADAVQLAAVQGDLMAQFRALWAKLEAEGLFRPELKRALPRFPRRIGVVTAEGTAAFQDVCNVLRRRYPLAEIWLSPAPVQGPEAAPRLIAALQQVDALGVDVILLVRGGGSTEDLWCFNDEQLARTLRTTRAPVITGIGHEIDTTLVDGTADQRAPTPSAAAEMATPDIANLRDELARYSERMKNALMSRLQQARVELDGVKQALRLVSPRARLEGERQRLDVLSLRLEHAMRAYLQRTAERLAVQARALEHANPLSLLARGYAIVSDPTTGKPITSAAQAMPNADLNVQLASGYLQVRVRQRTLPVDSTERPTR
ncbi:MAG: exodeoxyribonuclease VII large subunit [Candidatus Thermofonsia Clade 1 bacterium]|jgi:exodeoxyribonuclease VII large subunit|uniref:Exodeoxyribonuclease 7 large subunit n=1 Tax=Candidatus Thermofonsia Clade 1 bacterium TaxID=2364210 RepID=A0A2M8PH15_9CHLR|nr:MAG: exodeoxyribonuclease VII large subunit [Candidatus Thermofonsia Clade 1 bacterium]RMF51228.1 MAG: exodeoxyribonuclease VII large subunit [Chloroflexota bacterium]